MNNKITIILTVLSVQLLTLTLLLTGILAELKAVQAFQVEGEMCWQDAELYNRYCRAELDTDGRVHWYSTELNN